MLPKHLRLSRREIQAAFKTGRRTNTPHFSLISFKETKPGSVARFAVLVPKSIDKRSTRRNRLRRLFYKSLGEVGLEFPAGHFIFQLRSSAQKLSLSEISSLLKTSISVQINQPRITD